jgi:hypothetical protein
MCLNIRPGGLSTHERHRVGGETSSHRPQSRHTPLRRFPIGPFPAAVAAGGGGVWVTAQGDDQCDGKGCAYRPGDESGRCHDLSRRPIPTRSRGALEPPGCRDPGVSGKSLPGRRPSDPATNRIVTTMSLGLDGSADVAVDDSGIWVSGTRYEIWLGRTSSVACAPRDERLH